MNVELRDPVAAAVPASKPAIPATDNAANDTTTRRCASRNLPPMDCIELPLHW